MSVEISVSHSLNKNTKLINQDMGCNHIINAFIKSNLEGKFIPNISVFDKNLESGCTIIMPRDYNKKEKIGEIWEIIKKSSKEINEYQCSYLKIDGIYQGCILNYLQKDLCPHNIC
jgi:hypothetical protein